MKNKKFLLLCLGALLCSCTTQKIVNSISSSSSEETISQNSIENDSLTSNSQGNSIITSGGTTDNVTSSSYTSSNNSSVTSNGSTSIVSSVTSGNTSSVTSSSNNTSVISNESTSIVSSATSGNTSSVTSSSNNTSVISNETTSVVSSVTSNNSNSSVDYSLDYDGYYSSITSSLTGGLYGTLRKALTELIESPKTYTYSGTSSTCLGYLLSTTDVDSDGNMVLFYSQDKITPEKADKWNREHVWPQSLSGGLYGTSGPGADMHHIRPTATVTNSNRGNLLYGDVDHSSAKESRNTTYGTNTLSGWYNSTYFEPLDTVKGDAARICLYMYTCYFSSNKLTLTNVAKDIQTLVDWSNLDLPSEQEKIRNEKVYALQGNRNPYIDHPEWVNKIFGDGSSTVPPTTSSSEVVTSSEVTSSSSSSSTGTSTDISHEDGLTCTFTSASSGDTSFTDSNGNQWTSSTSAFGYDGARGIQFTCSSIGLGSTMTFESEASINDVCNIELTYGTNNTLCQVEAFVGATSLGTLDTLSTTSGSTQTLTFSSGSLLSGKIKLVITPSGSSKSFYLKQIVIK
ncbi:MAG: endonuclease I family protein [Bacilli bacterium]